MAVFTKTINPGADLYLCIPRIPDLIYRVLNVYSPNLFVLDRQPVGKAGALTYCLFLAFHPQGTTQNMGAYRRYVIKKCSLSTFLA